MGEKGAAVSKHCLAMNGRGRGLPWGNIVCPAPQLGSMGLNQKLLDKFLKVCVEGEGARQGARPQHSLYKTLQPCKGCLVPALLETHSALGSQKWPQLRKQEKHVMPLYDVFQLPETGLTSLLPGVPPIQPILLSSSSTGNLRQLRR